MASRWMQAKLAKMAAARKTDPVPASMKRAGHTVEASNHMSAEIAALVKGYGGVVTRCEPGRKAQPVGKQRRSFDTRTFGNGKRRWLNAMVNCR